jgi:hypothetical protein
MSRRGLAAYGLWAALTFCSAVLVHGVVHAAGARAFVWDSPAHVAMLGIAVALLAGVAAPLGLIGSAAERRRRLALVQAGLGPIRPGLVAFGLLCQAVVAGLLFAAEGAGVEPERLTLALVCGLAALLCSALVFRSTRRRVVAFLAALVAAMADTTSPPPLRRLALRPAAATVPYRLFIPNRPPPHLAT